VTSTAIITGASRGIGAAVADVSKPVEVGRMFNATEKEFGGVDVLVNQASIMTLSNINTADDAMFDRVVAVIEGHLQRSA
jgi:3-oxoacyl-[acyl-carrier protein] reductase